MIEVNVRYPSGYYNENRTGQFFMKAEDFVPMPGRGEGQAVIVEIDSQYKIGRVTGISDAGKAAKPIVCIIDDTEYKANIEKAKKRAKMEKELKTKISKLPQSVLLRALMEHDPSAKDFVEKMAEVA